MKKLILVSSLLVCFIAFSQAQLSLRPQVGIQFSSLSYESIQGELTGTAGLNFGADLQIGSTFYVQPGVSFNPIKLKLEDIGDIRINKFNVPIMLGYKFFEQEGSKAFGFRLFVGPNFAFTINETISEAINEITLDDLNKFHLSAIGGVGLDLSIFFLDLGYKYGLNKTISIGDGASLNGFMANAGIRIGF
jgi:hypothetical protein